MIQYPDKQHYDSALFDSLMESIEVASSTSGGRANLAKWILTNTSSPTNIHRPWSFANHEFQIEIVNAVCPRVSVLKASQLGVSEVIVRMVMALLAKLEGVHAIYTLPDANFARKFAPTRFDPVIAASPRLRAITSYDLNNNQIKQIGSSYLHITGAQSERQSISVPASILIHDEVAYSKQEVLGTYSSRLGHLESGKEIVISFSTPLLPNSSIHLEYLNGTQEVYMVYHSGCNHWVVIDPIKSIRIPGLSVPLELLSKGDVTEHPEQVMEAYVECPNCKMKISQENLVDASRRAWVAGYPERANRSFDANFLVLPAIKTPAKVLQDRVNYRSTEKWLNFAVGRPADSSDNRISDSSIERAFCLDSKDSLVSFVNVAGMDVGKTCHLVIGKSVGETLMIIESRLPRQDSDNNSAESFADAYRQFRCCQGVIDAGPENIVVKRAQAILPYNQIWGCYFVRGRGKANLEFYEKKELDGVVSVQRTKGIDEFAADMNHGRILFRKDDPNRALISAHLRAPARVTDQDPAGEDVSSWVSVGSEDHFFFALFYCWLAWKMAVGEGVVVAAPSVGSSILFGKARMRG